MLLNGRLGPTEFGCFPSARGEAAHFKHSRYRYAKSGDVHVAYQVTGSGPLISSSYPDLFPTWRCRLVEPHTALFFERLSSFCRLIRFDKRGTGLSDRVAAMPTLEERMDDVHAVMDSGVQSEPRSWDSPRAGLKVRVALHSGHKADMPAGPGSAKTGSRSVNFGARQTHDAGRLRSNIRP
jgi:hypothetical protein